MFNITVELINGLNFGLEHISPDEDDGFTYVIVLHLFVFRICFIKLSA